VEFLAFFVRDGEGRPNYVKFGENISQLSGFLEFISDFRYADTLNFTLHVPVIDGPWVDINRELVSLLSTGPLASFCLIHY